MKLKIIIHQAEECGFLAEEPVIEGCATQGDTIEERLQISMKWLKPIFLRIKPC
jgi:predicted RNase H-like HicB family nuclease